MNTTQQRIKNLKSLIEEYDLLLKEYYEDEDIFGWEDSTFSNSFVEGITESRLYALEELIDLEDKENV
jgi:hypothetical protein